MEIRCPRCGAQAGNNHAFCQDCGFNMRSIPKRNAREGPTGGYGLRSEPGMATASPRKANVILALVIATIVALAGTLVTFDLMAQDDSHDGDDEPEGGSDHTQNISPLDEWQVYSYGAFTSSVNDTVAMVSGEYDGEETIPDTGGWNAFWLVSELVNSGDFSFTMQIEIEQATGVEWAATIGLVVPGYSFPPHGTCNWGMYYYEGSKNSIGTWFLDYQGGTSVTVLDETDIETQTSIEYTMKGSNGSIQLYINGLSSGTREFPTDQVQFMIQSSIKYSGTEISVSFRFVE